MRNSSKFIILLLCSTLIALSVGVRVVGGEGCQLSTQSGEGGKIADTLSSVSNNNRLNTTAVTANQKPAANVESQYVTCEVLVRFKDDVSTSWVTLETAKSGAIQEAAKANVPAEFIERFPFINVYHLKLLQNITVEEAIDRLKKNPNVLYAEPNYVYRITSIPNDPRFNELWGLNNTGQTGGTPDADIDAVEAWDIQIGISSVVVAVIDTGVDYMHEDLAANMWTNSGEIPNDGIDNDGNGYVDDVYGINAVTGRIDELYASVDPMDDNGHGTAVAGIIGAVGNNNRGVVGVNHNIKIMALRAADHWGNALSTDIIECLQYVSAIKDRGVNIKIINNSYGGAGESLANYDAIRAARDRNVLFVAGAGNEGSDNDAVPFYPASYDLGNIIAVAATDHNDDLTSISNYGATSVDVAAPGENILSTSPGVIPQPGDIFYDNMEAGIGGWTADPPWALTNEQDLTSGGVAWSDSPHSDYADNLDIALTSPPIDLSGLRGVVRFNFWVKGSLDPNDEVEVGFSKPPVWQRFTWITGDRPSWRCWSLLISPFFRTPDFRFRFRLISDSSVTSDGIYIGDVGISSDRISTGYGLRGGTSSASPHVAGIAALISAQNGSLPYYQIKNTILNSVDVKPSLSGKVLSGGRVNAFNCLRTPSAPSGLSASAVSGSQINLSWTDNSINEGGFRIERKTEALGTYTDIAAVGANATSYSNTGLNDSTRYYYRVRAYTAGDSPYSNEANASTFLATPSALLASPASTSQINLTWADNSSRETGFKIERKTGASGVYTQIATVGANVTGYSNTGLSESYDYYYRVRAYNAERDSPYSNEASDSPSLVAPSVLSASASAGSSDVINLTWADNSTRETGFKIERKIGASGTYAQIATVGANATRYSDSVFGGSPPAYSVGIRVYYRVRAYNTARDSSYTNEADAVATPPSGGGDEGYCFIATAAYGSYLAPEVQVLRDFRDGHLLASSSGRAFVSFYYEISPPIANYIREHESLKIPTRAILTPLVYGIKYPWMSGLFIIFSIVTVFGVFRGKKVR